MRFSWKQQNRIEELIKPLAMSCDNEKNKGGLVTGVEKGFLEALLFIFSMILFLSHSLEKRQSVKL